MVELWRWVMVDRKRIDATVATPVVCVFGGEGECGSSRVTAGRRVKCGVEIV